tara:strand:- start:102 stop:824 length:723 start_codon:yes stop_codon:yes gene_type:complete
MAFVLTDQKIFVDGYDITGTTNALAIEYGAELKDCTVLGNDSRVMKGGLKTVQLQASGFYDAAANDEHLYANLGVADTPVSVSAEGTTVGDVAYFFKACGGELVTGETIGELNKFSFGAASSGTLVKGVLANNSTETATGSGTGVQLGAVGGAQKLYAVLHVIASSGAGDQTLDVTIGSDDNAGFTSELTKLTFAQATTVVTSEMLEVSGAITDDYFRVNFAIGGTGSPSFTFAVFFGVQ